MDKMDKSIIEKILASCIISMSKNIITSKARLSKEGNQNER